jgi:hypothetical protein
MFLKKRAWQSRRGKSALATRVPWTIDRVNRFAAIRLFGEGNQRALCFHLRDLASNRAEHHDIILPFHGVADGVLACGEQVGPDTNRRVEPDPIEIPIPRLFSLAAAMATRANLVQSQPGQEDSDDFQRTYFLAPWVNYFGTHSGIEHSAGARASLGCTQSWECVASHSRM